MRSAKNLVLPPNRSSQISGGEATPEQNISMPVSTGEGTPKNKPNMPMATLGRYDTSTLLYPKKKKKKKLQFYLILDGMPYCIPSLSLFYVVVCFLYTVCMGFPL